MIERSVHDERLGSAVARTIAAGSATCWLQFAMPDEPAIQAAGVVDFARCRARLRYEVPAEVADSEHEVSMDQVVDAGSILTRLGESADTWKAIPSGAKSPKKVGDPLGVLAVLDAVSPGAKVVGRELAGGAVTTHYRVATDVDRAFDQGDPEIVELLRQRLQLVEKHEAELDVWLDDVCRVRRLRARESAGLPSGTGVIATIEFAHFGTAANIEIPSESVSVGLDQLIPPIDGQSG